MVLPVGVLAVGAADRVSQAAPSYDEPVDIIPPLLTRLGTSQAAARLPSPILRRTDLYVLSCWNGKNIQKSKVLTPGEAERVAH